MARKASFLIADEHASPLECFECIDKFTDQEGRIKSEFFKHLHELIGNHAEQTSTEYMEGIKKLEANIFAWHTALRQQELGFI